MLYGTLSTGYKPGGFRLGGMQDNPDTLENESIVDNEELTAYEIGYKGTISDSLSLSSALFYYDYADIQVELGILDPRSGIVTSRLANASDTDVYGFELESTWAATDRLTLLANYSYLNSEYKENFFVSDNKTNTVRNVKGNELNRTPNNKFAIAGLYAQPLATGQLVFSANYTWIDEQFVTVFNDSIETIDSYQQLNGRITWQPGSGRYLLALFGNNLTDELSYANDYSVSALADGVRRSGRPINPRIYGFEAAIFF
jgi:iron complex outermembrane receptor protein